MSLQLLTRHNFPRFFKDIKRCKMAGEQFFALWQDNFFF